MIQGGARKAKTGNLKAVFIPCNRSREVARQDQGEGRERDKHRKKFKKYCKEDTGYVQR